MVSRPEGFARPEDLIVFLGPSLSAEEARALAPCVVWPPARQGDVWRALAHGPRALALVDGVFESQPSVWHHELLAALEAGVAVFGGGSMGALRAAELAGHGMVGVGRIFEAYRRGTLVDDSEVALLHADAELDWKPLTLPLVNARHMAMQARDEGVIGPREAHRLAAAAERVFYQERVWPRVLREVGAGWSPRSHSRFEAWLKEGKGEDLKREDAKACVRAAAAFVASGAAAPERKRGAGAVPSSYVRRRRLMDGESVVGSERVASGEVLEVLREEPDAAELAEAGMRRALLAGWARTLGLRPTPEEVAEAEEEWWASAEVAVAKREAYLGACGLDRAELRRLCEERALERRVLEEAPRLLPDGPSWDEALAAEARLYGRWAEVAESLVAGDEDGGE